MPESRRMPPIALLAAYCAVAFVAAVAFRAAFPPPGNPLPVADFDWRFAAALVDYVGIFPAVALAALVGAFGFNAEEQGEEARFSARFISAMTWPLVATLVAAAVYAALYLVVLPSALNAQASISVKSDLFRSAADKAAAAAEEGSWTEASRAMAICERIWPNSPLTGKTRDALDVALSRLRSSPVPAPAEAPPAGPLLPGTRRPASAADALVQARAALEAGRPYDAHWMAAAAARLAAPGGPEAADAARLSSLSWNEIASLEPSGADAAAFATYRRKKEGYAAASAGDWIRAYFIFEDLSRSAGDDPDVRKFLALSDAGARESAFFIDEAGASLGNVDVDALFSLPGSDGGRDILRAKTLRSYADAAFAEGLELLSFDRRGGLRYRVEAPYCKLSPLFVEAEEPGGKGRALTSLLFLGIDRSDPEIRWKAVWTGPEAPPAARRNRAVLGIAFEDLALASRARRGASSMSVGDLELAADRLASAGYLPDAFRAESVRRLCEPFTFLALGVFALAYGWRLRSRRGAGPVGAVILLALPFGTDFLVQAVRLAVGTAVAASASALPAAGAALAAVGLEAFLLIAALVFLAGQRG